MSLFHVYKFSFTHPYYIITPFFALFLVVCTLIYFHWEININVYERSLYKLDQTLMLLQETLDDPLWQMKLTEEEEGAEDDGLVKVRLWSMSSLIRLCR